MPKKTQQRARTRDHAAVKAKKSTKPRKQAGMAARAPSAALPAGTHTDAANRFVKDLVVRGEAAPRDAKGKVPQSATHAVKKVNPDGSVEVERVRFKTF